MKIERRKTMYDLEIQSLSKPHRWILCGNYSTENLAVERAQKHIKIIPLVKSQIIDSNGKVVWSNKEKQNAKEKS